MKDKYLVAFCTCPDDPSARALAEALVSERLAACVNRVPGVHSTFLWEGRLQEDEEILLIIKTSADRLDTLSARIQALHPYEVPEVVAVGVAGGSERYLAWLGQSVGAA
jgi:periplasmic divalent cation tolerance protein